MPSKILLIFLLSATLFAGGFNIDFFKDKPRSIERDFYIWLFLEKDNITPKDALIAEKLVYKMNDKLLHRIAKFTNKIKTITQSFCKRVSPSKIMHLSDICINIGLNTYEATTLSSDNLNTIISKLKPKFPQKAEIFEIMNSSNVFENTLLASPGVFFELFNESGGKFRFKHFDRAIPQNYIDILSEYEEFNKSIFHILTSLKFKNLPYSLLSVNCNRLSEQSVFYLALNAIKLEKYKVALKYLDICYDKAYFQDKKDRAVFWKYLLTGDKSYLVTLTNSHSINIYTLYAFEKLNQKPQNIITDISVSNKNSPYDIKDPFWWLSELDKIKDMSKDELKIYANRFNTKDTLPHKAYILQKSDFSKRYFITPYLDYITLKSADRKAILYAIAKQESDFIPTSISKSYALGLMQFLPYVAKHTAKSLKILNFKLTDMFDAQKSILIATFHIEHLRKYLKHPLFIAYGYNGGLGFAKRAVIDRLFKKEKFEPFMSMELIPHDEPREYGKKVLANYIIYSNIFGENTTLISTLRGTLN